MLKVKFRVHLDSFMETVRTKIEAGNYTPGQLKAGGYTNFWGLNLPIGY